MQNYLSNLVLRYTLDASFALSLSVFYYHYFNIILKFVVLLFPAMLASILSIAMRVSTYGVTLNFLGISP
jgi:hypothetical protein